MTKNFPFNTGGVKRSENNGRQPYSRSFPPLSASTSKSQDGGYKKTSALPHLQEEINARNLTNCIEILEWLGFQGDDTLIFLLATAQQLQGGVE